MAAARKVLLAVDASDQAEQAFDCKYWQVFVNFVAIIQESLDATNINAGSYRCDSWLL